VEKAARLITELAMLTAPCAIPENYANEADAQQAWESQGELLLAAIRARDDLRRVAARTGDAWQWFPSGATAAGPAERVGPMSDDPVCELKERAAQEARKQEAERQRQKLLRQLELECDGVRFYGERARTENGGSSRGLAEQIARFVGAVRAAGWE